MRLLAPATLVYNQKSAREAYGQPYSAHYAPEKIGAESVVGVMQNTLDSPITGRKNEVYVRVVNVQDKVVYGWLAEHTPMDRKVQKKMLYRANFNADDRITAWDQLRYIIDRDAGWDTKKWLTRFGGKQLPLLHAVIRELGGRVPKSDDRTLAVEIVSRLIFSRNTSMSRKTSSATESVVHEAPVARKTKKTATKKVAAKKTTKKVAAKKQAAGEGGPGRVSQFAGKTIVRLVKDNPRREDTHGYASWNLLRKGMTYEQYIEAGGRRVDLAWDIMKENVKLSK